MTGGALAGVRVVELAHELTAWAGTRMADLGAEVRVVWPPGGWGLLGASMFDSMGALV